MVNQRRNPFQISQTDTLVPSCNIPKQTGKKQLWNTVNYYKILLALESESRRKGSGDHSANNPVLIEERMRPCHWLGLIIPYPKGVLHRYCWRM